MTLEQRQAWDAAYGPQNEAFKKANLQGKDLDHWKYQRYIKDYLRCVASVDENVGRVLDYLEKNGLTENTIVVYTSDQGFYLGEHGWFDKRFMYEESLRMPLLVRYPKEIKKGVVNEDMVLNLDLAPTFLDYAGVKIPKSMQGRSLRKILAGKTPKNWREAIYYHYYEFPAWHMVKRHYGIRTERYKLIHFYYNIDAWEFYDLQADPHELDNRYDDPAQQKIIGQLKTQLEKLRQQYGDSEALTKQLLPK
jgi:arylsulfatase A-like enzyme